MIKKILQIGILSIAAFCLVTSPLTPLVYAQAEVPAPETDKDKCDKRYFSDQDIIHWDPCATENKCTTGQVNVTGETTIEITDNIRAIWTYLTSTPLSTNDNKPLTPVQAAGIMGNFDAESSFNPSAIEGGVARADKGHGLAQWTFGRWDGAEGLSAFASSQGKAWDDLTVQLDFLKKELEGSERGVLSDPQFKNATDPAVAAVQWRVVFERADPALAHDDRRKTTAVAIYNAFGGKAAACETEGTAVNGNFLQTALNFALTTYAVSGKTSEQDARDTYRPAFKKLNNPATDWSDCGRFVSTSIRASNVDISYPEVNVATQLAYVKAHPEKYTINTAPKINDLQPGDILFTTGHTAIYTGSAQNPLIDASLNDHVPSVRNVANLQSMMMDDSLESARIIK